MKYEIVPELTKVENGVTLHRIRALKSFSYYKPTHINTDTVYAIGSEKIKEEYIDEDGEYFEYDQEPNNPCRTSVHYDVNKGDLGGWVENGSNLSQSGNCWIADEATVYGNASVTDNAVITEHANVREDAKVSGCVVAKEYANIFGNAALSGNACISGRASIKDEAIVSGFYVFISGDSVIEHSSQILGIDKDDKFGFAESAAIKIEDEVHIFGHAQIGAYVELSDITKVHGNAKISGVIASGESDICGDININGNVNIRDGRLTT